MCLDLPELLSMDSCESQLFDYIYNIDIKTLSFAGLKTSAQLVLSWNLETPVQPFMTETQTRLSHLPQGVTRGYKDGLQPESLADGNWLVKQNQPVSKFETKSDTNLRSLYES